MTKPVLQPSAKHPITITPTGSRVTVSVGGQRIAESNNALSLAEASYPVVQYIPLADVDPAVLRRTDTASYCPFKGDASYYDVVTTDGRTAEDVIWEYQQPHEAVKEIAGHVAFWLDRGAEVTVD
jgi:uncharacterized protein (DUF427 family)